MCHLPYSRLLINAESRHFGNAGRPKQAPTPRPGGIMVCREAMVGDKHWLFAKIWALLQKSGFPSDLRIDAMVSDCAIMNKLGPLWVNIVSKVGIPCINITFANAPCRNWMISLGCARPLPAQSSISGYKLKLPFPKKKGAC